MLPDPYYPNFAAYMKDMKAARNAYAADEAVRAGLCAECQWRACDGRKRLCWSCRRGEVTAS